ncbi:ATP binding family protein-like protein [Rhizodiscina lignyota]|uniref:GPN-loop GTPase 3 n=1 Tax=Rhizodiscina lignyota TaxID=1504668 RepID=A0A9P4IL37_9PEZI|nr:ATP binding family protein-like protein [Rhizodiscina lignyota]
MSKFGVIVLGPAGAGKTTFCSSLIQNLRNNKRSCFYINLDPAAEDFVYEPDIDIKDLISLSDVMEEMSLGPNGGLIYCFEFLLENMDFLTEPLEEITEEYLIVIDMPGQIELYTHIPILPALVKELAGGALNVRMCAAYLLEATFIADRAKFFAGTLSAMSAMLMLEIPHVNILSKMDLVKGTVARRDLKKFLNPEAELLDDDPAAPRMVPEQEQKGNAEDDPLAPKNMMGGASFQRLNRAVAQLIDDFSMVQFLQLDVQDEDSVGAVLSYIDDAVQYHEAQEPKEPTYDLDEDMEDDYGDG